MKLGKLTQHQTENGMEYTGQIVTYSLNMPLRFILNQDRRDDNSPTHNVLGRGPHGSWFHCGVAWQGETNERKTYFSFKITIGELGLKDKEYVAFQNREGTGFAIAESKPREEQAA